MPASNTRIKTIEELRNYLYLAMQLEHATIPPYLLALYSIHPGKNLDASQVLRVVVVEEMLHLTLAANLMNAIGGEVNLATPGFVPKYPARLPDGEQDFEVDLRPFSCAALQTFEKIERVGPGQPEEKRFVARQRPENALAYVPDDDQTCFWSIGEFYEEIVRGMKHLDRTIGPKKLFCGNKEWQIDPSAYHSGGGQINVVTDLKTACEAARLIIEQGEGLGGAIYNHERELAHFYRFQQLLLGKFYLKGDQPNNPTGPELSVEWDAAYCFPPSPKLADYPPGSDVHTAAIAFNEEYAEFLAKLTEAFQGRKEFLEGDPKNPQKPAQAVPQMDSTRNSVLRLLHNPFPGNPRFQASPTFEVNPA